MLRVCIVGFKGYWAQNLMRAMKQVKGLGFTAFVDATAEPNKDLKHFNKLEDALHLCDVVIIATPPDTHFELAMTAIAKKKHVLIEKPMTTCPVQAAAINLGAKNMGVKVGVDHTFLFSEHIRIIKKLIDKGKIGTLLRIESFRQNLGKFQNSGVIWDLMPHDIAMANYLVGGTPEIETVRFMRHLDSSVIDTAIVDMRYNYADLRKAHSPSYSLNMSWLYPKKVRTTAFVGTEGMIEYDMLAERPVKIYDKKAQKGEQSWEHSFNWVSEYHGDFREPLQVLFEEFRDTINKDTPFVSDGAVGEVVVKIISDAYKAEANGTLR